MSLNGNPEHGDGKLRFQDKCEPFVTSWNTWPGGVTGIILVHSESDPAIDTWAVSLEFDRVILPTL